MIGFMMGFAYPVAAALANGPDLTGISVTGPATGVSGKSASFSVTVRNIGTVSAGSSYVYLYLSSDTTMNTGDIYIGKEYVSSLGPSLQKTVTLIGTIPVATSAGSYYIVAVADGSGRVAETDEGNNGICSESRIIITEPPKPDLLVTAVSAPSAGTAGKNMALSATVKNGGAAVASSSYVYFYLSTDTTVTPGDIYVGRVYISSLSPGGQKNVTLSGTIPVATSAGSYYIGALADGSGRVAETDEGNNGICSESGILITEPPKPDLVVPAVSVPPSGTAGERVSVSATIKNAGDATASSSYAYFYLSTDTTVTSEDIFLGKEYVSSLSAGSLKTVSYSAAIPPGIPEGTYYIGARADGAGSVAEQNEGNNAGVSSTFLVQGPPLPDLIPLSLTGPLTGSPGGTISIQLAVRNGGLAGSVTTSANLYLSSDPLVTPGDILLGSVTLPAITAGSTTTVSKSVGIPVSVEPGTYYLGVLIDTSNSVKESDENNNNCCSTGTIDISAPSAGTFTYQVEAAIIKYTNQERDKAGIASIRHNPVLSSVARSHSEDMKVRNFFSHTNPEELGPAQRLTAAGYRYSWIGENIAYTPYFSPASDPDEAGRAIVQDQWMKSSGHRENILSTSFSEIGVGVAYEPDMSRTPYGVIATQLFATPL